MKSIFKNRSNCLKKNFSILENFKEKFQINFNPKINEIDQTVFQNVDRKVYASKTTYKNKLINEYIMEEEKIEFDPFIMKTPDTDDNPVILSKKIETIVCYPHLLNTKNEEYYDNPKLLYDILLNSSFTKNLTITNNNELEYQNGISSYIYLVKYIKIIFFNFPQFIHDKKIQETLKKCMNKFTLNVSYDLLENFKTFIEFNYEIIQIRDRVIKISRESEINIVKLINNFFSSNLNLFMRNSPDIIFKVLKDGDKNKNIQYIFKLVYILSKSTANFNNASSNTNYIKLKNEVEKLIVDKEIEFSKNFEKEKLIIFYLCLNKLGLLRNREIRNIKFNNFCIDSFHILFKILLSKPQHIREINSESVVDMMLNESNLIKYFTEMDIRKSILIRDTFEWNINTNLSYITFQNQYGSLQMDRKIILQELLSKMINSIEIITDPGEIIHVAYMLSAYHGNPVLHFEKISEKIFDIADVNTKLLDKFLDSVIFRLKYLIRYDHEIHILRKVKRDIFIPYSEELDKIIVYIAKQFLYKVENDLPVELELFGVGLKSIKILFSMILIDPNYKINEGIAKNINKLTTNCLFRGSKFLKYINPKNAEIIENITEILPHLKFYYNLNIKESNNKNTADIFENFILNCIKQTYENLEVMMTVITNISQFIIFDNITKDSQQIPITVNTEINNFIYKQIENIFKIKKNDNVLENQLEINFQYLKSIESKVPVLLINLYNLFSSDRTKYKIFLNSIENYFKNRKGLRNLKGYNLLKIQKEIMNENTLIQILSNLQTIKIPRFKDNLLCHIVNKNNIKNFVLNICKALHNYNSGTFNQLNLSSLSFTISTIFDTLTIEETIEVLKALGNKKIEHYHPAFMKTLITKFSERELIFDMMKKKENLFFDLGLSWPLFLKNEELVRALLQLNTSKLLQIGRYEIINILCFNHINHSNLLSLFSSGIKKVKNQGTKKKLLCDFLSMSTYVGNTVEVSVYEDLLTTFEEVRNQYPFNLNEMIDFIVLSIISKILDTSLSSYANKLFFEILHSVNKQIQNKLSLNIENEIINYYPCIPSEDRFFSKSLTNVYTIDSELIIELEKKDDKEEEKEDEKLEEQKSYLRKNREGQDLIDIEFENYFQKKKELLYGHQNYLNDDFATRQILKKWCVTKLYNMKLEDEYLENQMNQILKHIQHKLKTNTIYQKFYLKLLSYGFQFNFTIESDFKDFKTGFRIDFLIQRNSKNFYLVIIPENFTSSNIFENKKHPDGIYNLLVECISRNNNALHELISINESDLSKMEAGDYHHKILNKILRD